MIHPVSYATTFNREMLLLIGGTIIVILYMFAGKRYKVDRWEGALLLGVFLAYTIFLIQQEL